MTSVADSAATKKRKLDKSPSGIASESTKSHKTGACSPITNDEAIIIVPNPRLAKSSAEHPAIKMDWIKISDVESAFCEKTFAADQIEMTNARLAALFVYRGLKLTKKSLSASRGNIVAEKCFGGGVSAFRLRVDGSELDMFVPLLTDTARTVFKALNGITDSDSEIIVHVSAWKILDDFYVVV